MKKAKQTYLEYWKQLKLLVDDMGLDWTFASFEGESLIVVRIGSPKYKICLGLNGANSKAPHYSLSAGFWIPDAKEAYTVLRSRSSLVEAEMGKALIWDMKPGRKSCWIWITVGMDISSEKSWPASFEWFADKAQKIRDVCHHQLSI
jgi:hypothetical protein